jgi:hypothetical protein
MLASLFSSDHKLREVKLSQMKKIWTGVLRLESIVYGSEGRLSKREKEIKALAANVLSDISWNATQIAREAYAVALECNFDPNDEELRALAYSLYGHPLTTQFHLENVFNHLLTVIRRLRKNLSMNKCLTVKTSASIFQ